MTGAGRRVAPDLNALQGPVVTEAAARPTAALIAEPAKDCVAGAWVAVQTRGPGIAGARRGRGCEIQISNAHGGCTNSKEETACFSSSSVAESIPSSDSSGRVSTGCPVIIE